MAEATKLSGNHAPPKEPTEMFRYRDCVDVMLRHLSDFGKQLRLGDAALRIEVNHSAVNLTSSSEAHVHGCLQEHIAKLQAVSESLRTLMESEGVTSTEESMTDKSVTSPSPQEQTAALPELHQPGSEAVENKTPTDDVMVQIRAGKSEVGPCQRIRQLFLL
ncbi:hypothetical protein GOODEAATRI_008361 [Goodea atripinnis]|uniref:Uncharacterized protein n=1 Tax=Goodea atripinnis TaxID=208336 RepID=A0ABV0NT75_9TELE